MNNLSCFNNLRWIHHKAHSAIPSVHIKSEMAFAAPKEIYQSSSHPENAWHRAQLFPGTSMLWKGLFQSKCSRNMGSEDLIMFDNSQFNSQGKTAYY